MARLDGQAEAHTVSDMVAAFSDGMQTANTLQYRKTSADAVSLACHVDTDSNRHGHPGLPP
jgi:hypothetical protein